jgi:hypothetical protein
MNIVGALVFSDYLVTLSFRSSSHVKFWVVNDCSLGFAYIAVAKTILSTKMVDCIIHHRKLIYATHWTNWILNNKIRCDEQDTMAGLFMRFTGSMIGYFVFFFIVFIKISRKEM